MRSSVLWSVLIPGLVALCSGCASYRTPGGPAVLADRGGQGAEAPSARFPARLVLAQVQGPGYRSQSATALGQGALTVLPAQALLASSQLDQIGSWPSVSSAITIDPALLPDRLDAMDDLRMAAAKLQGDVLLSFTVATVFQLKGKAVRPMTSMSLPLETGDHAGIVSTVSAVFIDVRTGFNYGSLQTSARIADLAAPARDAVAVDRQRIAIERQAFEDLLLQARQRWAAIAEQYD